MLYVMQLGSSAAGVEGRAGGVLDSVQVFFDVKLYFST